MKVIKNIVQVLSFLFVFAIYQTNANGGEKYESVQFKIVEIGWSSKAGDIATTDTTELEVKINGLFGGKGSPYFFKLIEIIDSVSVKIQFTDDLVVVGEPVAYPSKQNPIIISGEKNCFRTRYLDGGSDFCIDILEIKNQP